METAKFFTMVEVKQYDCQKNSDSKVKKSSFTERAQKLFY